LSSFHPSSRPLRTPPSFPTRRSSDLDASVSASDDLNPHLSERQLLAVFPSVCLDSTCTHTVQYVIVDLNSLTIENRAAATSELKDRKSTRLNSSHVAISYAVFCLKKK